MRSLLTQKGARSVDGSFHLSLGLLGVVNLVKGGSDIVIERLSLGAHEDWDDEEDETEDGVKETHDLPEDMVSTVGGSEVSLEGEHEQPPDGPGDEELDGETPPEFKGINPLGRLLRFVRELGHGSGKLSDTVEEDLGVPLAERKS